MKIKLDDGTVWTGELTDNNTVIIDPTPEYLEYYQWNYGGGNEFPQPVNNEYELSEIEIIEK